MYKNQWSALAAFIALLFSGTLYAQRGEGGDKFFMLVLGDSITKGVWADTTLGEGNPKFYWEMPLIEVHMKMLQLLSGKRVNDLSNTMKYATLIDRNFDYISRRNLSALIGDQPYSIPSLIKKAQSREIEVFDASILAGCYKISNLIFAKIEKFFLEHKNHHDPDLVFLNFSAMDFVFNSTIDDFEDNVRQTFARVAKRFPNTTIVVTPLLDVVSMMTASYDMVTLPAKFGVNAIRCADSYRKIGFDVAVGVTATISEQEIFDKTAKLAAMQRVLDSEISALQDQTGPAAYEQFSGRVIRVDPLPVPGGRWSPYLAVDCIHPNTAGQRLIGQNIWRALQNDRSITDAD